jgi:Peptidase A4 family
MKAKTFPPPPADFDPLTASDQQLLQHGYPRRPDQKTEPVLRRLWDKAFERRPTLVPGQLVEDKRFRSRPHADWLKDHSGARADRIKATFGLAGDWAGAVVEVASLGLTPPEPANVVYAEWTVPTMSPNPAEPGTQIVGFWVGLGGYGTSQLLQAGTAATVTGNGVPSYWAWTEWVPAGYTVVNFPVAAGDLISVLVCAPQADSGFVTMMNQKTNYAVSYPVFDPEGTTPYDGSTVEWIVEAINTEMPNFGSVTFTEVTAGTQHHTINLLDAFTVNATSGTTTLANGKIYETQNEVEVIWDAAI